jgi:tetratricopeptide (TPR) repeat protein
MSRSTIVRTLAALLLTTAGLARAQQATHETHGAHEEAPAAPRLGEIDFPTSASPAAHAAFVRGVLFMHNFHYPQAAERFRQAQKLDPADVMSFWGEAMTYTHPVWNEQDTAAAHVVLNRLGPTREARLAKAQTVAERRWLEAVEALYAPGGTKAQRDTAYAASMASMHQADPQNVEATTFYALALLGLNQGERDVATYQKAYAILAPVFASHPHHPGAAHYLIHATDDPDHAAMGLDAANAYGDIAPSAGHAIHMTSHIFLALGKWDDVVSANQRAQATVPGGFLSPHVVHWLHYGLLQQGRYREADHWLDSMATQARTGPPGRRMLSWDAAGLMAGANLADTKRWSGVAAKIRVDSAAFDAASNSESLTDLAASEFGFALGALFRGETAAFNSALAAMTARRTRVANDPNMTTARGMSEVMEKTLRGYALQKNGDTAGALALFRGAASQESQLPMPFGPPSTIKPPREAAGDLLMGVGRPAEARNEFLLALARTPRRTAPMLGLARAEYALGNNAESRKLYRELVTIWHAADAGLPELAEARSRVK